MNLVDSSGWLEYFIDGANAELFAEPLLDTEKLIVPVICIYEVFKVILKERNEDDALQVVSLMQKGDIVDITPEIAISAAKISLDYSLPMADSIILATARKYEAIIYTQDIDFKSFPDVKFIPKHS